MSVGWDETRISGTGPEKSFPVIRARVFISIASNYLSGHSVKGQKKSRTDGNTVIKTMINSHMILFVLGFEFVFT